MQRVNASFAFLLQLKTNLFIPNDPLTIAEFIDWKGCKWIWAFLLHSSWILCSLCRLIALLWFASYYFSTFSNILYFTYQIKKIIKNICVYTHVNISYLNPNPSPSLICAGYNLHSLLSLKRLHYYLQVLVICCCSL